MVQIAKKIPGLCLVAYVVMLLAPMAVSGTVQEQQTAKVLQPQSLNHARIHNLRQIDPGLTGSGVKFAVICRSFTYIDGEPQNDYRPSTKHDCFAGRQFGFDDQFALSAGISPHSTAICSVLFGEDPNAFSQQVGQFHYRGVTTGAEADIYEFRHFLTNNVFGHSPPKADIITAGIGSQFEDWWTRGIESIAEHYGLIVVAGIGNGLEAYDPVLYPGAGANIIGVGVVNSVSTEYPEINLANFSLAYPEHSSCGPTVDGRCKPDIVAPGNCLAASVNEPNSYEDTGNWSSFSMPLVAGTAGLLVQKAKEDPNLSAAVSVRGGNCVIKAILLNSAEKLPYWHKGRLGKSDDHEAPLDYIQGAGMLNAVRAYEHLTAGQGKPGYCLTIGWDNNLLDKTANDQNIYRITLTEPKDKVITATAAWNRHYKDSYPFESIPEKDNNLRIELWAVDVNDPNNDYLLDYSDSSTDNLEHIYRRADANYTDYEITVSFSNVNDTNRAETMQRYGLAWNVSEKQNSDNIFWYDLNADAIVNELDFIILLNNHLASIKTPERYLLGDINSDGVIDFKDLQIMMGHMGRRADWYTE